jgi:hypothetical protein
MSLATRFFALKAAMDAEKISTYGVIFEQAMQRFYGLLSLSY